MHGSQKCCSELVEQAVDDIWQNADAGDQELCRPAYSVLTKGFNTVISEVNVSVNVNLYSA